MSTLRWLVIIAAIVFGALYLVAIVVNIDYIGRVRSDTTDGQRAAAPADVPAPAGDDVEPFDEDVVPTVEQDEPAKPPREYDNPLVARAVAQVGDLADFCRFFPKHRISVLVPPGEDDRMTLTAYGGVYDRYLLQMLLEVQLDESHRQVIADDISAIRLWEMVPQDGELAREPVGGPLNRADWDAVVATGGDLSMLGLPLITNRPVEGFDEYFEDDGATSP
jgi:hypothetical protein